jgi:hypothetical protein
MLKMTKMDNYKVVEKVLAPLFMRELYPLSVTETKEDQLVVEFA